MTLQPKPVTNPNSEKIESRFRRKVKQVNRGQYEKGMAKYGTSLMTFNGRNPFQDAMEEWSDLGRYITQMDVERLWLLNRVAELEAQVAELTGERDNHDATTNG
jgi:hypothetical protein